MTVNKLLKECMELVNNGYGDKTILISNDDEGNGFHTLHYSFTCNREEIEAYAEMSCFHDNQDVDDVVLLG